MATVGATPGEAPDLTLSRMGTHFQIPALPDRRPSALEAALGLTRPGFWVRYQIDQEFAHTVPWGGPNTSRREQFEMHKFVIRCVITPDGTGEHLLTRGKIERTAPGGRWAGPGETSTDSLGFVYYLFISPVSGAPSTFRLRHHSEALAEVCVLPLAWTRPVPAPNSCGPRPPETHELSGRADGRANVKGRLTPLVTTDPEDVGGGSPGGPPEVPTRPTPDGGEFGNSVDPAFGGMVASVPQHPRGGNGNIADGEVVAVNARPTVIPRLGVSTHYVTPAADPGSNQKFGRWEQHTAHSPGEQVETSPETQAPPECHIRVGFTTHANSKIRTLYKTLQVYPASDNAARGEVTAQAWPSFETIWRDDAISLGR